METMWKMRSSSSELTKLKWSLTMIGSRQRALKALGPSWESAVSGKGWTWFDFSTTPYRHDSLPLASQTCVVECLDLVRAQDDGEYQLGREVRYAFGHIEISPMMPASLKDFETVFPTLVKDIKEHCEKYKLPDQALTWFEKVWLQPMLSQNADDID